MNEDWRTSIADALGVDRSEIKTVKELTANHQLYSHGVIDVCVRLHACDTGSGDGIPDDERDRLIAWLRWRIDNWTESRRDGWGRHVDSAVRQLAIAVLHQADAIGRY